MEFSEPNHAPSAIVRPVDILGKFLCGGSVTWYAPNDVGLEGGRGKSVS